MVWLTHSKQILVLNKVVSLVLFFSLYINDLIDHFGPDCEPLELNRKPISCLLYADDIILLSESAKGLQKSLDILKTYCDKWNLKINIGKTKVIVFNKSGRISGLSCLYCIFGILALTFIY